MSLLQDSQINNKIKKNKLIDKIVRGGLLIPTIISASFVFLIIYFITARGVAPFLKSEYGDLSVDVVKFFTGNTWFISPNIYGIFFIIINTLYVVFLSALIAIPISVITALFIAKMTPKTISNFFQTVVEMLAAIPSIVFGVFGLGVITKLVKGISTWETESI